MIMKFFFSELKKSNYFKNCTSCRQVKNRQQILQGKCDALHDSAHIITDYSGCDKCCKLRNFLMIIYVPLLNYVNIQNTPKFRKYYEIVATKMNIRLSYTLK